MSEKILLIEMVNILNELSTERPIFHSEADFQHALAWKIHEKHQDLNIRLEKKLNAHEIYLDLLAFNDTYNIAVELKYKTKKIGHILKDEEFNLKDQGAHDQARYDFIKDISRLEKARTHYNYIGFAIFLTNDQSYWKNTMRKKDPFDKEFRIHEGNTIKGKLCWQEETSEGTMSGRDEAIILESEYNLNWEDYFDLNGLNGKSRFLLIEIN